MSTVVHISASKAPLILLFIFRSSSPTHLVARKLCADKTSLELLDCWQAPRRSCIVLDLYLGWRIRILDWLCFQNLLSVNLEQYSLQNLRNRADGKQKRTSRSVLEHINQKYMRWNLSTSTNSVSHTYRLTKSHSELSPGHRRNPLKYDIAKHDWSLKSTAQLVQTQEPRPGKKPQPLCPGFILWLTPTASQNASKVISSITQQKTGQRAMVTAFLGLIHRAVVSNIHLHS